MKIDIKLDETAPQPVDANVYNVEIEKVGDLRTVEGAEGADEVIDITWKILDEGNFTGRRVVDTYWLVERALWRVSILCMQALGIPRKELPQFTSTEELEAFMKENLQGARANIEVEVYTKNDQERNRVKKIHAVG